MLKKQSSNKTPDPSLIILLTTLCLFLSFFVTVLTASNMILLTSLIFALLFMSVAELLYNKEKSTINIYAITLNFFANVSLGAASLIAFYKIFNDLLGLSFFLLGFPVSLELSILLTLLIFSSFLLTNPLSKTWLRRQSSHPKLTRKEKELAQNLSKDNLTADTLYKAIEDHNKLLKKTTENMSWLEKTYYTTNNLLREKLEKRIFNIRNKKENSKTEDILTKIFDSENKTTQKVILTLLLISSFLASSYATPLLSFISYKFSLTGAFAPWCMTMLLSTMILGGISYILNSFYEFIANFKKNQNSSDNPKDDHFLDNNPIISFWHCIEIFFEWFYKTGITSPIVMTTFSLIFFSTVIDLYTPFLFWHNFNLIVLNCLMNPHYSNVLFSNVITGFIEGQFFLLLYYLYNNKLTIFEGKLDQETFLRAIVVVILITCLCIIELSIPAIHASLGTWKVFNLITYNIKPAILLLDTIIQQDKSILGSFMNLLQILNPKKWLKLPKELWRVMTRGVISFIIYPIKHIALPILHVYLKATIKTIAFFISIVNYQIKDQLNELIFKIDRYITKTDISWSKINEEIKQFAENNPAFILPIVILFFASLTVLNIWTMPLFNLLAIGKLTADFIIFYSSIVSITILALNPYPSTEYQATTEKTPAPKRPTTTNKLTAQSIEHMIQSRSL